MKTAVVILNWNTKEFLEKFLPGVLESAGKDAEVIVADSGSTDGSMEMMKEKFPEVRRIELGENLGFTGGYNKALSELDGFEYFVLLNSDIEVPKRWLEPLVEWMETNPDCGACAPKLLSWYKRDHFEYAGAAGGMIDRLGYPFCRGRVMKMVELDYGQYNDPKDVFWASGACLMVRSKLFRELGGLDARFFAHMEEIDFCWRLQLLGYRICVVPGSEVYHLGGGTLPANSPQKILLNFRNNLLMLENNLAKTYGLRSGDAGKACRAARLTIAKRMILDGLSALVYVLSGKISWFRAVIQAHREYRRSRIKTTPEEVGRYLQEWFGKARVSGIYDGHIVLQALIKGNKVFENLHRL